MEIAIHHLLAMTLFALAVSVTFAFLTKGSTIERCQYVVWSFLAFLGVAVGLGWLMYLFSH